MKWSRVFTVVCLAGVCACDSKTTAPSLPGAKLTAPTAVSPSDQSQLNALRPTLSVTNGTSDTNGNRAYEFQVADKSDFSTTSSTGSYPVTARQGGVPENGSGTTSWTPDFDLQPATKFYWRARLVQGPSVSDWTATRSFNTAIVGYNRAGELYDPLIYGTSVGTIVGSATFLGNQGLRLNDGKAYVRYLLADTVSAGEFSLEIAGLHANGPGAKLKLFTMENSTASVYDNPWLFTVQYRGVNGNPDNCIAFKMRLADPAFQLESDGNDRALNVVTLDPTRYYFFRAMWDDGFRMTVQNGINGSKFYDLEYKSTDYFDGKKIPYAPSPHYAYLGSNEEIQGPENGTFPGEIVRNVFIGSKPRPASLGSALRPIR